MKIAQSTEAIRLETLRQYQILDTAPEEIFDALSRVVARICQTPIAAITLIDAKRQWFKSRVGFEETELPLDAGFCRHTVSLRDTLIIHDTMAEKRFAALSVKGATPVRYYAGVPLITPTGHAIGTLCIMDHVPRELGSEQIHTLHVVAYEVLAQLELRRKNIEMEPMRERIELIRNATGEGVYGLDSDGIINFVNSAAARMLGWKEYELLGKPMHELVHHSYLDGTPYPKDECPIHLTCKYGQMHQIEEETFWRKDGANLWVRYTSSPITRDTQRLGAVVVFEDISERKRMEQIAYKETQFLNVLLSNLEEGIVACNEEGILTLFNNATRKFHGLPEKSLPAEQWADYYDLYLPDGKTRMRKDDVPLFRALQGEAVTNMEMVIAPNNAPARTVLVNAQALFNANGQKLGAVAVMHDITERKRAEHERDRFFDLSLDILCITSFDGTPKQVNPAFEKTVGWTFEDIASKSFLEFIHPEDHEKCLAELHKIVGGGATTSFETRYLCKDGSYKWLEFNALPLVEHKLIYAAARDVTQRRQAEQRARANRRTSARQKSGRGS